MIVCIYMVISSGQSLSLSRGDRKGCVGGWYFRKLLWQISEITRSLNFSFLFFFLFPLFVLEHVSRSSAGLCSSLCLLGWCYAHGEKWLEEMLYVIKWKWTIKSQKSCRVSDVFALGTLLFLRPPRISGRKRFVQSLSPGSLPDGCEKKPNNNPGTFPAVSWSHFLPSHSSYFVNKWMNERCWQKRPAGGAFRHSVHRRIFSADTFILIVT